MYHEVEAGAPSGYGYAVSLQKFRQQIRILKQAGYEAVTLRELAWAMQGKEKLPKKPVVVTFDDGYEGTAGNALPVMREHGMRGVIFAIAGRIGGKNDWDRRSGGPELKLMGEVEIGRLLAAGWELGAHTVNHPRLTTLAPREAQMEIRSSKETLEEKFKTPVNSFSYPYGVHSPELCEMVRKAGYKAGVTIFSSAPSVTADPWRMRRVFPHAGDSSLTFRLKLSRPYLRMVAWRDGRKFAVEWPK
jgi:peptidoglycan/xylan/chitin deacetylase (PgdA/CDA1 family)